MNWFLSLARWVALSVIGVAIVFTIFLVQDAKAAPQCVAMDGMIQLLADRYGESVVGEGVAGGGSRLLIFTHPDGDTWSVVVVLPDGQACLMASGADWTMVPLGSET